MRPSRQLKPSPLVTLERRVVPSHAAATLPRSAEVGPGASAPVPGPSGTFPLDIDSTLRAGIPVRERITTSYADGTTETTDRLIVPDGNDTRTTTDHITLRGSSGTETVVSVLSTDGNRTTGYWTYREPDGSIETETSTVVATGHRSVISETIDRPSGNIEAVTGKDFEAGPIKVLVKRYTGTNGLTHRYMDMTVYQGPLQKDSVLTIWPRGSVKIDKTVTTEIRLPLPNP